jgi:hypothetical protein
VNSGRAGAEVDAAQTGGYGTTLGQVATSVNTARAGVQIALMEILLEFGAAVDGFPGGWSPLTTALHNGQPGDCSRTLRITSGAEEGFLLFADRNRTKHPLGNKPLVILSRKSDDQDRMGRQRKILSELLAPLDQAVQGGFHELGNRLLQKCSCWKDPVIRISENERQLEVPRIQSSTMNK